MNRLAFLAGTAIATLVFLAAEGLALALTGCSAFGCAA